MADHSAQIATKFSALAPVLVGPDSIFSPTFWDKTNLHVIDDTVRYQPVRDSADFFGGKARFIQPKRATLTTEYMLRCTITQGVIDGAHTGAVAVVNNFGDQLARIIRHRFANTVLHEYDGEYQQLWQRLTVNEVDEEGRNALTFGGLPLTVGGELEQQRGLLTDPALATFDVYIPLNRLWFSQHLDEAWMPEAYSTNGEIEIEFATVGQLYYTTGTGGGPPVIDHTDPFTTRPRLTNVELIAREVTLTAPEKLARLSHFESDRGLLTKFLDLERQTSTTISGTLAALPGAGEPATREVRIKLDAIRLDMQEIIFIVRRSGAGWGLNQASISVDFSGDRLQAPVYDTSTYPPTAVFSQLPGGAANKRIDTLIDGAGSGAGTLPQAVSLVAYRLEANNRRLTENQFDLVARTWSRKFYHKESQAKDPIFHISFSAFPEESKNVYGFQNAANLGTPELVLTISDFLTTQEVTVDVWCHSHNLMQARRGDIVKSMK